MKPRLASAALLLCCAAPALALKADRQQPMDIGADYSDATLTDDGSALLKGNVQISQGSLKIHADEAQVHRAAGEIKQAVLSGAPATVEQLLDGGGQMRAQARTIDYDMKANLLVLKGGVVVTQPEGELRGEQLRYDLNSGRVEGGAPGSRVQMRIEPKPAAATPADTSKPAE